MIEMTPKNLGGKALEDLEKDLVAVDAEEEKENQQKLDDETEKVFTGEKDEAGSKQEKDKLRKATEEELDEDFVDTELNEKGEYKVAESEDEKMKDKEQVKAKGSEELKNEMEESYQELVQVQEKFIKAKEGQKKLNTLRAFLGSKKSKEIAEVSKDFETTQAEFEKSKNEFRKKFGAFGQFFINQKQDELRKTGENEEEIKNKILKFMCLEKVIDTGKKNEKNEAITRTISEEYHKRLFDLDKIKLEKLPSKTKKVCKKLWEGYRKLPRSARLALGTSLAIGIGAATGAIGGVGAAALYGGKRAMRGYFGMAIGGAVSGSVDSFHKDIQQSRNLKSGKTEEAFKQRARGGLKGKIRETLESDRGRDKLVEEGLLKGLEERKKILDRMNEHQRKQLRNRMIAAGVSGVAAGGGFTVLAGGLFDTDSAMGSKPKVELGQQSEIVKPSEIQSKEPTLRKVPITEPRGELGEKSNSSGIISKAQASEIPKSNNVGDLQARHDPERAERRISSNKQEGHGKDFDLQEVEHPKHDPKELERTKRMGDLPSEDIGAEVESSGLVGSENDRFRSVEDMKESEKKIDAGVVDDKTAWTDSEKKRFGSAEEMEEFEKKVDEGIIDIVMEKKLEKGDSVWKVLESEGMTDREIMNKLNTFSKDMGEKLMSEHRMTKEQAMLYINGRFGHMDVGEQFQIDKDGNLVIDNFINDQKLGYFKNGSWEQEGISNSDQAIDDAEVEVKTETDAEVKTDAEVEVDVAAEEREAVEIRQENESNPIDSHTEEQLQAELNDKLASIGVEINSRVWNAAREMPVERLLEEVPPDQRPISIIWHSKEDITNIDGLSKKIPGVTYWEFKELQKLSNFIAEHRPSSEGTHMRVEDFLKEHEIASDTLIEAQSPANAVVAERPGGEGSASEGLEQEAEGELDLNNHDSLFENFQKNNFDIDMESFEKVNQMSPKQAENIVFAQDSSISPEGKNFMKKIIATNLNAKAGESFEEYLWRYIENEDVPVITQEQFNGLGEIYESLGKKAE